MAVHSYKQGLLLIRFVTFLKIILSLYVCVHVYKCNMCVNVHIFLHV